MKLLILTFFLLTVYLANGQASGSSKIQSNGFYQTKAYIDKEDKDTTYRYLRFYTNGKVIGTTSEGTAFDLKGWFDLGMKYLSVGNYKIHGKRIYFSTTSDAGTVVYKGKIKDKGFLTLKSKSLINGYGNKEKFYFISFSDMGKYSTQ